MVSSEIQCDINKPMLNPHTSFMNVWCWTHMSVLFNHVQNSHEWCSISIVNAKEKTALWNQPPQSCVHHWLIRVANWSSVDIAPTHWGSALNPNTCICERDFSTLDHIESARVMELCFSMAENVNSFVVRSNDELSCRNPKAESSTKMKWPLRQNRLKWLSMFGMKLHMSEIFLLVKSINFWLNCLMPIACNNPGRLFLCLTVHWSPAPLTLQVQGCCSLIHLQFTWPIAFATWFLTAMPSWKLFHPDLLPNCRLWIWEWTSLSRTNAPFGGRLPHLNVSNGNAKPSY